MGPLHGGDPGRRELYRPSASDPSASEKKPPSVSLHGVVFDNFAVLSRCLDPNLN
jgi:hypothetical protein